MLNNLMNILILILLSILIFFMIIFLAPDYYLFYKGSLVILLFCVVVFAGAELGKYVIRNVKTDNFKEFNNITDNLKISAIIMSILGFMVIPLMLHEFNVKLLSLFHLSYLRDLARIISTKRYSDSYETPMYIQLVLSVNYTACLINGIYSAKLYHNKKIVNIAFYMLPLITSILFAFMTTQKAVIIFSIFFYFSSFMVTYNTISEKPFKLTVKNILTFLTGFIAIFSLFVIIQMIRYNYNSLAEALEVLKVLRVYTFGHISAFTSWFQNAYLKGNVEIGYGRYTFGGIFNILGISEREPGIFPEFFEVSQNEITNVFTAFRCLIQDFTIYGAFIIMLMWAFLTGVSDKMKHYKYSFVFVWLLIVFYSFSLNAMFISLFNYNSIILSFFLLLIILFISYRKVTKIK